MLDRKVIATKITNLTDARYFAARGVDYLLFDMADTSLDQIIEIKEWIEGPQILLLFDEKKLSLVDEAVIRLSPSAIAGIDDHVSDQLSHLSGHVGIFSWSAQEITMDGKIFLYIEKKADLSSIGFDKGIIITGSLEDKVGLKAFDPLDEILDALEGLNAQ